MTYRLTPIADTSDRFSDFAPYVASINDRGVVAFQAALRDGGTGVFLGDGGSIVPVADTSGERFARFYSHPDIANDDSVSVYAESKSGLQGVFFARAAREDRTIGMSPAADTTGAFASIGPLGPTMNDRGTVAFRAEMKTGGCGVFTATGGATNGSIVTIADTKRFRAFHGLPVVNDQGTVVFRADLEGGGQGIYADSNGLLKTIADTNHLFDQLGSFPCVDDAGTVVFSATRKTGRTGIYAVTDGEMRPVVEADDTFESFRGALINDAGTVIFYATPRGGRLGIYAGPDATADRLLAIGAPMFDSTVVDFALNPVSLNHRDQLAIRVGLANQRQLILRADRAS